jgi:hypothetical protein
MTTAAIAGIVTCCLAFDKSNQSIISRADKTDRT